MSGSNVRLKKIHESFEFIKSKIDSTPEVGLILGSGLGVLADEIKNPVKIDYKDIPNFPISTVEGHAGCLVFGELNGKKVLAMNGRFHYYEGYSLNEVVFPVHVMNLLGIRKLLVTNAAGGINTNFDKGSLMIIKDHINFTGNNALIGANINEFGRRFPDMSEAYSKELIKLAKLIALENNIKIEEGIYYQMTGPCYETPAEIRALRLLGADAVGMSTVPEVTVANHCGIKVLGISCITNMAAGILDQPLNHEEVMETAERVRHDFLTLVKGIIEKI